MLKKPDCFSRKYKENDKKGCRRQPFCFYFMRFGETQSKDQSTTGIISSEQLRQQQVVCAQRGAGIRLSPHFYTPVEVLDDTLALLRQWASRG